MLQIAYIKENKEKVIAGLKKRHFNQAEEYINKALEIDQNRRETQQELDSVQAESNLKAKLIGSLMKEGKKDEAEGAKTIAAELRDKAKLLSEQLNNIEEELRSVMTQIPNLPHHSVPEGKNAEDNLVVLTHKKDVKLDKGALPHWELIKKYDIIDFDLGNKISGAGFPVYKGKGARLQRAMISFFLEEAANAGYMEIMPPLLVNEDSGFGTGQLPDKEGQMYHVTQENLYLIPTAEVPITNIYRNVILKEEDLPVKNVGYTSCFRREAGSWGADVRGLNRLHQFDKVEIVQVTRPEASYEALDDMVNYVEGLLQKLELPYRILKLCGGDMGFTSALTFDFEVFSAAQNRWLEVSSVSNFESYQANRLKLRYKVEGKTQLLHTLNGSALALPRILAALLENNQRDDGILVPDVLVPFAGFDMI